MKKTTIFILMAGFLFETAGAFAQQPIEGVKINNISMFRNDDYIAVDMDVNLSELEVAGGRAVVVEPWLVNGADSVALPAVGVYGRRQYYYYLRNDGMISGDSELAYKAKKAPEVVDYHATVPYEEWMNGSHLYVTSREYGCCNHVMDEKDGIYANYNAAAYHPSFRYLTPANVTEKAHSIGGRAMIEFPVGKSDIYPDQGNNFDELMKILSTVDSVSNDTDVTIKSMTIKGFSSPEGPYAKNAELAAKRTEAVKKYISSKYDIAPEFIATSSEAEDWAGLREYVAGSSLAHRAEILAIIDGDLNPDAKEWKIKSTYPEEYKTLLKEVYPSLRHTEYDIEYAVRSYNNVNEIREVIKNRPQKLSLNEMYLLAQSLEQGSEEYNDVFETAVRMYPNDEVANLNAANSAMGKGDMRSAERYLAKAGESAEAVYARGVYAAIKGDYAAARNYLKQAQGKGLTGVDAVLAELDDVEKFAPAK